MGATCSISPVSRFYLVLQNYQSIGYLSNITFIFNRCHRSLTAVTPVKYECDSNDIVGTFSTWEMPLTEKLTKLVSVTPTCSALKSEPTSQRAWYRDDYMPRGIGGYPHNECCISISKNKAKPYDVMNIFALPIPFVRIKANRVVVRWKWKSQYVYNFFEYQTDCYKSAHKVRRLVFVTEIGKSNFTRLYCNAHIRGLVHDWDVNHILQYCRTLYH